jgi:hypothetical protein
MAQHRVEAVGVVLGGRRELEPSELRQARATHGWTKLEMAQLLEPIPVRHPLVPLDGEIPCLDRPSEVV